MKSQKSEKSNNNKKNTVIAANQPKAVAKSSKTFVFRADDTSKKTKKVCIVMFDNLIDFT